MIEANLFILTNMKGHKMFCFVQILVYTIHEYVHFTLLINGIQIQSKFYLKSHSLMLRQRQNKENLSTSKLCYLCSSTQLLTHS